jgi:histidinol dehydrogenase
MRLITRPSALAIARLASRDRSRDPVVERAVQRIVSDVRRRGDEAVRDWRQRLDQDESVVEVTSRELRAGWAATPRDVRVAIRTAIRHARAVAERQRPRPFTVQPTPGIRIEQRVSPLERVACYVPGGRYPLPSTVVMTVVPAQVAGVSQIVVACPRPSRVVMYAAIEAGATQMLRVGGAQAIAAMAYGTRSIPRVDKIVGPGNAWVAAAKMLVAGDCAIDMHAGPSEIVVWSTAGRASWIAADLIAQAEHDPAARAIFVTTSPYLAGRVACAVESRVGPRDPARAALARNGVIVVVRDRRAAINVINAIAPEHLVCDRRSDAEGVRAGALFVGRWSAQAAGDYATGSNHVLPTGGAARFRGGLSAADCVGICSVHTLPARGLRTIATSVITLAEAEGLHAHADSVRIRLTCPT